MKLLFLYDTIKHPQLMPTVSTLQVVQIAGNTVSFTGACGHLATMVSKFPKYQITRQNLSFVEGYRGIKGGHAKVPNNLVGIHTGNGDIYTGYYTYFFSLSNYDQEKFRDERKRVGHKAKGRDKNGKQPSGMLVMAIKAMKDKLKAQTITISYMIENFDIY